MFNIELYEKNWSKVGKVEGFFEYTFVIIVHELNNLVIKLNIYDVKLMNIL